MDRTPPSATRRELRQEVGFGCPVAGCGNPYLTWHHFDPPWNEKEHHDADGMVALCPIHHHKADAGAFTISQLREMKAEGKNRNRLVSGTFDWRRNNLLAVLGGQYYLNTPSLLFRSGDGPLVSFDRAEDNSLELNLRLPNKISLVENNVWMKFGLPEDIECPPSGKLLRIKYRDDLYFRIAFEELGTIDDVNRKFPKPQFDISELPLPITSLEIHYVIKAIGLEFTPNQFKIRGNTIKGGGLFKNCGMGITIS